jgi:hypothetical protein
LRRIQAGLDAREATHGAAGKFELHFELRDSPANNPRDSARPRTGPQMELVFFRDGDPFCTIQAGWTRAERTGLQEMVSF